MAASISVSTANDMLDAINDKINAAGAGRIIIYDGTPPANVGAALSGNNALVTFDSGSPSPVLNPMFSAASSGTMNLSGTPITEPASASGVASFFRILPATGTAAIVQGSVSTTGAELNLNTTTITASVNVTITSGSITMPTSGS